MKGQPLTVYLPDQRDVIIGRFGCGGDKLGPGVFTYSRLAGVEASCPGATVECEAICYAKRIGGSVKEIYARNSDRDDVPELPVACRLLRIHVSGDFDTPAYILNWTVRLKARPDVTAWGYTRSWRCRSLLEFLEQLRALPNVQLFASMDPSTPELPPAGWRRAWLWRDRPHGSWSVEKRLSSKRAGLNVHNMVAFDGSPSYVCPEETGRQPDCVSCGYCFKGRKHDVTFIEHSKPGKKT